MDTMVWDLLENGLVYEQLAGFCNCFSDYNILFLNEKAV